MDELDCSYMLDIVCPYCGSEEIDSIEYFRNGHDGDQETITCGNLNCEKDFKVTFNVEATYSSEKIEVKSNGEA